MKMLIIILLTVENITSNERGNILAATHLDNL